MIQTADFRDRVLEHGILDPEGIHHVFSHGMHGRKLDFGQVVEKTPLYNEWIDLNAAAVSQKFHKLPDAIIGVAWGTNRLSRDTAARLGIMALFTRKISSHEVELTKMSQEKLKTLDGGFVVSLEDVGTTGGTALTAVSSAIEAGADEIAGLFTWQRREKLQAFEKSGVEYKSIIYEPLIDYDPNECSLEGYCAMGWKIEPH